MPKQQPQPYRNRIVGHGEEAPDQLLAHPDNPKIHPKRQTDALNTALSDLGWIGEVIVNTQTGHVIDGHDRIGLAISRGEPTVPITYIDISPVEELKALATFDPIGALAATDDKMLEDLLAELSFADEDFSNFVRTLSDDHPYGKVVQDDVPEVPAEPITRPGDLWLLGSHRLLCGDATNADDVARLMDGSGPRLLVTDPPYGVAYDPRWRDRAQAIRLAPGRAPIPSGDDVPHNWAPALAHDWLEVAYCWAPGGAQQYLTQQMLEAAGFEVRQQIIWVKPMAPLSRSAYHWQHEPCWYAVREGRQAGWRGDRSQTTVWEAASPTHIMSGSDEVATEHATQKPVLIMSKPLENHDGDVYDPFVGSGTTVVAAEQLGRRCYAMDIEPAYCDVTVQRWEKLTGKQAERQPAEVAV